MSIEAVKGFATLFILNPEIQNRLRGASSVEDFLEQAVAEGKENNLNFTKEELENGIFNYAKGLIGEAPACEAMEPPQISHMRSEIPPGEIKPIIPVGEGADKDESIDLVVNSTLTFLNSTDPEKGPGICHW